PQRIAWQARTRLRAEGGSPVGSPSCALAARDPHEAEDRDDFLAAARLGAERDGAGALKTCEIVVWRGGLRGPLVGAAGNAEPGREAVQLVDVVREQVAPFESLPLPDRLVDIDGHDDGLST